MWVHYWGHLYLGVSEIANHSHWRTLMAVLLGYKSSLFEQGTKDSLLSAVVLGKGPTFHQSGRPNLRQHVLVLTSGSCFICMGSRHFSAAGTFPWRMSTATSWAPGDSALQGGLWSACSILAASGL